MAERLKALDLKSNIYLKYIVGSNPTSPIIYIFKGIE